MEAAPYSVGSTPTTPATLAKGGDIRPAAADEISLPPPGTRGLQIIGISPRAAALLKDCECAVLQGEAAEEGVDINPCADPNLRVQKNMVKLVARMAAGGMTGSSGARKGEVALFAVVKKLTLSEKEQPRSSSRLVFDERLENLNWRRPPWRSPGAGTALGFVDAST